MATTTTIRAHEMATLLDRAPAGITTLSLDCFDTLLWRNTHAPCDVFAELAIPGGGIEPRSWAERIEHGHALSRTGSHEVTLDGIYRRMVANGDDADVAAAVERELLAEARHLFAFAPTVALMRAAKARGLRVVIVSDMYLSETRLRRLLADCAGTDVVAMIDHVFVSCEYGRGKAHGLFDHVLRTIGARPDQVLHVGDNKSSDHDGAARAGIHAVHLKQFDADTATRLRLEMVANVMIDPAVRVSVPALQPHRAAVSMRTDDTPAHILGHDVIGPLMHSFAEFVHADVQAMTERVGRPVRPLFLMRDGHLPFEVYTAAYPDTGAVRVELSRLVATRASLADEDLLDRFLMRDLTGYTGETLARHLMLEPAEYAAAVRKAAKGDVCAAIAASVQRGDLRRRVLRRAAAFRTRMIAHLRAAGVRDGEAVMMVDLGYAGSVQNTLTPVLERQMGLTVAGRYLVLRESVRSGLDKRGLLDTDMFDTRTLNAITSYIAVVEQMCNVEQGSTIDFTADGTPIREEYQPNAAQHAARMPIQSACIAFARDARNAMHTTARSDDMTARRRMAGAILTRLLFLPMPAEIALFEAFEHDDNMGTSSIHSVLDRNHAATGLRQRGLAYINGAQRIFVTAEIAQHGLPLSLALMATSRFGLDIRNGDFQVGGIEVPVLMLDATDQTIIPITAYPTHDGWYRIAVPVARGSVTTAVQLGSVWSSVQIDGATWVAAAYHDLDFDPASQRLIVAERTPAITVPDAMSEIAPGIFSCDATGVVIIPPAGRDAQVLNLVFRPLAVRETAVADAHKVAA
ncbi:HAD family hydrolase [Roseomonas aeriglobus]|nr:HAD family hydrolase [Roseomonas aeriglobus]